MSSILIFKLLYFATFVALSFSSPKSPSPYSFPSSKPLDLHSHSSISLNNYISPRNYTPNWSSLDSRPLPGWYDDGKIGIFLHWGVFSVPSYTNEWFWYWWASGDKSVSSYMASNYPPRFTYQDFARDFTAEFWDPNKWADLFAKAGAKYLVLTSKHHEGFTLWPSKYSFGWNSMDVGPKRDLVGELASAVRNRTSIRFGLYHSWFEFYNPMYLLDKKNGFKTSTFVRNKALPEFKELVNAYKPEVIWSDGDWEAPPEYWKSQEFLAWLYNISPVKDTVVVNDRWGNGTACKHGGFFNCQDHFNPGVLPSFKWENAMTIDKGSWGYRRTATLSDYHTPQELITELVSTVACGGNFLINVGPMRDGMIAPLLEERLLQIGAWLGINGDAIYGTVPWERAQNDTSTPGVWYTAKPNENKVFGILLENNWPSTNTLILGSVSSSLMSIQTIGFLGLESENQTLSWAPCDGKVCKTGGILVNLPNIPPTTGNKWGWTLVINHT